MIEIKNIYKKFGKIEVLKGVSAQFKPGLVNMIIGASGTGKSVLLKCMVGLEKPSVGEIYFDNRSFTNASRKVQINIRKDIGMLFQGAALFDSKTVEENVRFPLDILTTLSLEEKEEKVNRMLDRVGLKGSNAKMPSELSGGMKKRVGIARAIVNSSKYLFCDEPNSGLDPQTSIRIDNLIKEITREYNITTIIVSHDMNSVMEIGDNIIYMDKGEKMWEGVASQIFNSKEKTFNDFVFANSLMRLLRESKKT